MVRTPMIKTIQLKFGRSPCGGPELVAVTPITVFVGPNNSGKSKVLTEIDAYCRHGLENVNTVILDQLKFTGLDRDVASEAAADLIVPASEGEHVRPGHVVIQIRGAQRPQVVLDRLTECLSNPELDLSEFCMYYLGDKTMMLDGRQRINLVNEQPAGDLQAKVKASLGVLFCDDDKRREVRRIVAEAFGLYFVVDPTYLGRLRIRLSRRPPASDREERGIDDEAVRFHAEAIPIDSASDGVKAFTGIITALTASDPRVVLIDEPEAFLHPALAFNLGNEVSRAALRSDQRVFASTHSPSFVSGCLQSGAPVTIIRLTYRDGVASARVLASGEILEMMRNPLLRSTGVLSGLFYEFVVVTESDADRAFYQEVNERLLRFRPDWGIPNCLFINAQNKQTVHTIVHPLRKMGIPAAGIVDIDVLKEGGTVWSSFITSGGVPPLTHQTFATHRSDVKRAMDATGRDMKRDGGVAILPGTEREAAQELLAQLAGYGLFIVAGGELESWLKHLGATGHGPSWLIDAFERMGEDPEDPDYVRPSGGDVWEFIASVRQWLMDPVRKGIPG